MKKTKPSDKNMLISSTVSKDILEKTRLSFSMAKEKLDKNSHDFYYSMPETARLIDNCVRGTVDSMIDILDIALKFYPDVKDSNIESNYGFGLRLWKIMDIDKELTNQFIMQVEEGFEGFLEDYSDGIREHFRNIMDVVANIPEEMLLVAIFKNTILEAVCKYIENDGIIDFRHISDRYFVFSAIITYHPTQFLLMENSIESKLSLIDFANNNLQRFGVHSVKIEDLNTEIGIQDFSHDIQGP